MDLHIATYVDTKGGSHYHQRDCPMINPPGKHPPYTPVPFLPAIPGQSPLYYRGRRYNPCPKCSPVHRPPRPDSAPYGTGPLTQMLRHTLKLETQPDEDGFVYFTKDVFLKELNNEQLLATIKAVFKEWLRTVGIPEGSSVEDARRLLVTLVDEPGQGKEG